MPGSNGTTRERERELGTKGKRKRAGETQKLGYVLENAALDERRDFASAVKNVLGL